MITLTVVSYNGQPQNGGLSVRFDELGGTIGRADTNQLVLPDPDRAISRVHAQVVYRNGAFAVVDRGSNPILVNGQAVGNGREQRVQPGDSVQIGGYLLSVTAAAAAAAPAASSSDPFADLLGPSAAVRSASPAAGPSFIDPLAAFNSPVPQTTPGVHRKSVPPPPPASASASLAGGIPDDWDPFAPDPVAAPSASPLGFGGGSGGGNFGLDTGGGAAGPLIPGMGGGSGGGSESSLDNLFGLGAGKSGADPFANSVLDAPMAQPNMAASADPMASLNSAPKAMAQAAPDNFSLLNTPFQAPPTAKPQAPPPAAVPSGAVMSWDKGADETHTVIRPSSRPAGEARPAPSPASTHVPTAMAPAPARAPSPSPSPAPAPAPAPFTSPANGDALLAAFREGLAVPGLQIDSLTPELMRLIGGLLHEAASGTVDLLVARAALKREVRAEATMIVARENNPLKFSPTAEAALAHLLSPPTRGFMAAAPAMRDAFDDLRAHQFGFIAGMRAALEGVLDRFDPAELEGKLTQKSSGLMSILPGSRKARMWEVFTEHYEQISTEAEDDFHSLFGKAFLAAYEEHIDQLKNKHDGGDD